MLLGQWVALISEFSFELIAWVMSFFGLPVKLVSWFVPMLMLLVDGSCWVVYLIFGNEARRWAHYLIQKGNATEESLTYTV